MSPFEANRWVLATALLAFSFGTPRALPAQTQSQVPAATPATTPTATTPASATPAQTVPPLPPPTPEQLGDALVGHQRYQAAIAAYAKEPQRTAAIWNKMGIAYQMMFNSSEAARCYKQSLKLDPGNPDVLNNLGTVYASLKQYGQADRLYRKALKLTPRSALILKNLGTNLLTEHKYNKGWEAYQQALAIDPEIFTDHSSPTVENPSNVQDRGAMNYYMAAGCARAGYTDCALQYLRLALNEGFTTRKKVASDAEFAGLRNNPAFQQLLAEEQHNQKTTPASP